MEKEFIPYNLALELKDLGFDEPCFGFYVNNKVKYGIASVDKNINKCWVDGLFCTAPTFSQAFRFFREKYQMNANIDWNFYAELMNRLPDKNFYYVVKNKIGNNKILSESFETYEEAELECLKKLVEITKEQNVK
jgi:hypothetical protein